MTRYYFDVVEGDYICTDDQGMMLGSVGEAIEEAVRALGDFARDRTRDVCVEVRDDVGPVMRCNVSLELLRTAPLPLV